MSNVAERINEAQRIATVLNGCIEVCIDGEKNYAIAAANVRNHAFKEMLQHHSDQRASFVLQLQDELIKLGFMPENEGTVVGSVRRGAMAARRALERRHNDYAVLRECIREEEAALHRYVRAMRSCDVLTLPVDLRVLLDEQLACIQSALDCTRQRLDVE